MLLKTDTSLRFRKTNRVLLPFPVCGLLRVPFKSRNSICKVGLRAESKWRRLLWCGRRVSAIFANAATAVMQNGAIIVPDENLKELGDENHVDVVLVYYRELANVLWLFRIGICQWRIRRSDFSVPWYSAAFFSTGGSHGTPNLLKPIITWSSALDV